MTTSGSLQGAGVFSLASSGHYSLIDSTVTQLWLPEDACSSFESHFGLTYDTDKNFYLVNDTTHANLLRLNPTITFTLGGSTSVGAGGSVSIALPYAAFDLKLGYPYENETHYFPIRRGANRTQYVLGRTLLQEAYLVVDYERRNFSLAPAVFSNPMPQPTVVEVNRPSVHSDSSTLSKGAVVAITIAGVSLVLALVISLFCIKKRRARRKDQRIETSVEQSEGPDKCLPSQELDSETRFEMLQGRIEVMAGTLPHELAGDSRHGEGRRATSRAEVYELPGA